MGKGIEICIWFKLYEGTCSELVALYGFCLTSYEYSDEVEQILAEHIKDMYARLAHMANTMQKSKRLSMNYTEALCFLKLWSQIDLSTWPLADVIVKDMIGKIDKVLNHKRATAPTPTLKDKERFLKNTWTR